MERAGYCTPWLGWMDGEGGKSTLEGYCTPWLGWMDGEGGKSTLEGQRLISGKILIRVSRNSHHKNVI